MSKNSVKKNENFEPCRDWRGPRQIRISRKKAKSIIGKVKGAHLTTSAFGRHSTVVVLLEAAARFTVLILTDKLLPRFYWVYRLSRYVLFLSLHSRLVIMNSMRLFLGRLIRIKLNSRVFMTHIIYSATELRECSF